MLIFLLLCKFSSTAIGNIVFNKTTKQSSLYYGGYSHLAVDSDTLQSMGILCSHTEFESKAWWAVDLGALYDVTRVVLFGRTECCTDRFSNFDIDVIKPNGCTTLCHYQADITTLLDVTCPSNTVGRYVRVRLRTSNYLTLCEAQVYGQLYVEPTVSADVPQSLVCIVNGYEYLGSTISEINLEDKQCILLCLITTQCSAAEYNMDTKVCKLKRIIDANNFYQESNTFSSDPSSNVYLIH